MSSNFFVASCGKSNEFMSCILAQNSLIWMPLHFIQKLRLKITFKFWQNQIIHGSFPAISIFWWRALSTVNRTATNRWEDRWIKTSFAGASHNFWHWGNEDRQSLARINALLANICLKTFQMMGNVNWKYNYVLKWDLEWNITVNTWVYTLPRINSNATCL